MQAGSASLQKHRMLINSFSSLIVMNHNMSLPFIVTELKTKCKFWVLAPVCGAQLTNAELPVSSNSSLGFN